MKKVLGVLMLIFGAIISLSILESIISSFFINQTGKGTLDYIGGVIAGKVFLMIIAYFFISRGIKNLNLNNNSSKNINKEIDSIGKDL